MRTRILVVEDEPAIADTLTYALTADGFDAVWKPTGHEGLEALEATQFDLILLDVGLPDLNGFDVFREAQKIREVPVIFLTARSGEIDRVVGLELGADDYISKPFSLREVCARVRTVLRRVGREQAGRVEPPGMSTATPATGNFIVDDMRKLIQYHGKTLELSRTEYRLLKTLVVQPGCVFSRDQLMEAAWDHPDVSLERTVDAHIKQLRAKLREVTPALDPIQTHRGMGYSLKEA